MHISGKRLTLRDVQERDIDPLTHWLHPRHEWHKLNGPYYPPTPPDKIPDMVANWLKGDTHALRRRLPITDNATDKLIGMVSRYWISAETNWTAIGIVIYDSAHWGRGYGYDALGMWCEYLFTSEPKFARLDLRTWSGNVGMVKLAEKLGFQREATFRKARIVDGEYYDGLGYGILREEWNERYAGGFAKGENA